MITASVDQRDHDQKNGGLGPEANVGIPTGIFLDTLLTFYKVFPSRDSAMWKTNDVEDLRFVPCPYRGKVLGTR